jgi:hypothetical protein
LELKALLCETTHSVNGNSGSSPNISRNFSPPSI